MTDPLEQELRDEIKRLMAEVFALHGAITQALDDMGEDGQGVTLETKNAMRRAVGDEEAP